jgi:cytochrome c553
MRVLPLLAVAGLIGTGTTLGSDAASTWLANCTSCHGKDGSGSTAMGKKLNVKDYREARVQAAFSDAEIESAIRKGVKTNGRETMKPFGGNLSDSDIKALVTYVRQFKK